MPEQLRDDDHRQRVGQRGHQVEPVPLPATASSSSAVIGVDLGLQLGDHARGERLTDQTAQLAVLRRVHADEVAAPEDVEVRLVGVSPEKSEEKAAGSASTAATLRWPSTCQRFCRSSWRTGAASLKALHRPTRSSKAKGASFSSLLVTGTP